MFDKLTPQPPDPLLVLIDLQRADPRQGKIDLGVGVYRDANGQTPVMRAVKAAETRLLAEQDSKAYVGAAGDPEFLRLGADLALGLQCPAVGVQTPGGTGALRLGSDLLMRMGVTTIWVGRPTWANHDSVFLGAGLTIREYPYFDARTQTVDFAAMRAALRSASPGDAVILQASCHNPTGADLDLDQWAEVAAICADRGIVPFIDVAYQGLGDELEADAAGARKVLAAVPEALVAVSMSKSFGVYRERTGALYAVSASDEMRANARTNMLAIARANYSMPPDHGAAIVRMVMADPALRADWVAELSEMRTRITALRQALAAHGDSAGIDLKPLARQHGMFSLLPLSPQQIERLRADHAVYMTGFGRVNLAGLGEDDIEPLVAALKAVTSAN